MITRNSILAAAWMLLSGLAYMQELYVTCIIASLMSVFYVFRFKEESEDE